MQSCMPNAQVLALMGLELAEYERIIGNIYDSAMDTRSLSDALREVRALFKANFVTLILRVQDEPPEMSNWARAVSTTTPTTPNPPCSTACPPTRCSPSTN